MGNYQITSYSGAEIEALLDKIDDLGNASQSTAGLMSAADKKKLDGLDSGAQANVLEAVKIAGADLPITEKKVNIPVDSSPTSGSNSLVRSGGVFNAIKDFITRSVNDLVYYYTKSETYTKTEVNNIIGSLNQFNYEIYASTSAVTNPQSNVLYLIGPTGTGSDKYEEYVYSNGWVKIGDTTIDLSGYSTTEQMNAAINNALRDYATKEEVSQLGQEINAIQNATIPGNNNTLSYKDIYNIKPGHTYRMYLKNPDYDVSGVTTTSGVYRMQVLNNGTTQLVNSTNFASALEDYYDFTVPDGSNFIRFAFRATLGISVYIELVDMTALSEIILTNDNVKQSIADVLGLGVNLFNYTLASTTTTNGVTITKVNATQFRLNGTATANINWLVSSKGYSIDTSVSHKVKIGCSNTEIDGTKVYAFFGGFKSDNSQVQGTRVATNGGYVAVNYDSSIVSSRVQFHIDSGQTFENVLFTIYDVTGDTLDELADSITEMDAEIAEIAEIAENKEKRNGQIVGKGNVYTSIQVYGLLPGQRYCLNLDDWDLSGVTAGNIIFEVVNFVGSNYTRLIYTTALDVKKHYSFIVPNVSDYIKIGGRIATGKTALWEIVPDDSHLFGEVGQYQGAKISLNEYRMMRWFNLLDYGSLSLNMASQGFDIWGDYLFQAGFISGAATANNIAVVDLKNRTIAGQVEFTDTSYHMNNINCGVKYADADTYPLLYVSQTYGAHKCSVIQLANNLASYTTIQEIAYSGSAHFANSNAYDWFIDLNNGYIYAFGNVAGSVTRLEIVKFSLPATSIADVVFTDDDVLDSFFLNIPGYYQGTRMIGGKLFAPVGLGSAQYPSHLLVVDLDKKEIISDVNFGTSVGEIEGCAPYNDLLVINNVSTNPIYRTIKF